MLINALGPAGAEWQVRHLALGLAHRGHEVTIACQREPYGSVDDLLAAGVRIVRFGAGTPRGKLRMIGPLVRMARRADVVHCTMWDASLYGRLTAILARRPVVVSEHTPGRDREMSPDGKARASWIAAHNRLLDRFTYATVACARWQFPLLRSEGVEERKLLHIANGVPIRELRAQADGGVTRAELGIPDDATVLVHVARFQPQKNQPATLEVVRRLRADLGDVHALFVGQGSEHLVDVEAQAATMGAEGWAHFLGARSDVPALLKLSDLFVLPSLAEAMPMAIIEALALGVPVVATDVGDVRRVVERTGGGIVVPPGEDDAYEAACRQALAAGRPGVAGALDRTMELFDADAMVDKYATVLAGAVAGTPPETLALDGA